GRDLDRQGLADPRDGPADARRRGVGEHLQPVRPDVAVRWLQGVGLWARGRHARTPRVRPAGGPLMAANDGRNGADGRARSSRAAASAKVTARVEAPARVAVRKTYKLYIGGTFPRTESGRSYLVEAADGTPLANACRASRKDVRDAVRAARKAFAGWA